MFKDPASCKLISGPSEDGTMDGTYQFRFETSHHRGFDHEPVRGGVRFLEIGFYVSGERIVFDVPSDPGGEGESHGIVSSAALAATSSLLTKQDILLMRDIAVRGRNSDYTLFVRLLERLHSRVSKIEGRTDAMQRTVELDYAGQARAALVARKLASDGIPLGREFDLEETVEGAVLQLLSGDGSSIPYKNILEAGAVISPHGTGANRSYYKDEKGNIAQIADAIAVARDEGAVRDRPYSNQAREELLKLTLGLPGPYEAITASPHVPSKSSDTEATYYWFRDLPEMAYSNFVKRYLDSVAHYSAEKKNAMWSGKEKSSVVALDNVAAAMKDYTLSGAYDEEGRFYVSVYDVWDLKPKLPKLIQDKIDARLQGVPAPPEIYFRIYCNPETGALDSGPGWDVEKN